jgi:hypothetical protein
MHHLKESGNLEEEAYGVLLLDRPGLRGEEVSASELHVLIEKIRSGEPGVTLVGSYRGERMEIEIHGRAQAPRPAPLAPDEASARPSRNGKRLPAHPGGQPWRSDDDVPF